MPSICKYYWLGLFFFLISCRDTGVATIVTFEAAFPKANKNLENILGSTLTLKRSTDTLHLKIKSRNKLNLITDAASGDTIFYGKVCKYRGLYYFNQAADDSMYFIHAVKIKDNLVYGLGSVYEQMRAIQAQVTQGHYRQLVTYQSPDSTQIELRTQKQGLRQLFAPIVQQMTPDTILATPKKKAELIAAAWREQTTDPEEYELLAKAYPNPAQQFINIELQQPQDITWQLTDLSGKTIRSGHLPAHSSRLDLTSIANGYYSLILTNPAKNQTETVKIRKN